MKYIKIWYEKMPLVASAAFFILFNTCYQLFECVWPFSGVGA